MSRIIAIANQKGGAGKTTTAINLSACLAERGKNILVVDIDPQGNTTSGLGVDKSSLEYTVYDLILSNCDINDCLVQSPFKNLTVIPSSVHLAGAEIELIGTEDREFILKELIDNVKNKFDFIIIDCPPSLNTLTVNALTTASQLIHTINLVTERLNSELYIEGVVFTMYDARTNLSLQVVENVKENLNQNIYKSIIPRNIKLAEAPSYGMPINIYDSKSTGADAYRELASEVIDNANKNR